MSSSPRKQLSPSKAIAKQNQLPSQENSEHKMNKNSSLPQLPVEYASEFLDLNQEMKQKLAKIDEMSVPHSSENHKQKSASLSKLKKRKHSQSQLSLSRIGHKKNQSAIIAKPIDKQEQKQVEKQIKRQFLNKMKAWQKEKQELEMKKQILNNHKLKKKQEQQEKKRQQEAEEAEFHKLEKKKQLQQKIHQIEERRRQREESLKNAVLKRSYNGVPKYLQYEKQLQSKEDKKMQIDLKLLKNKKQKMSLDPEVLRAHEKAYIQRIKQRLNMSPQKNAQKQQINSDFNLYLKRSEQLKKAQLQKIIRRKKFQQKISKIPLKIDEEKKQELLIVKDKAKNLQKYHILSQKALKDHQIYEEFRGLEIRLDPKEKGNDYLQELKKKYPSKTGRKMIDNQSNKANALSKSQSQQVRKENTKQTQSLPKIQKVVPVSSQANLISKIPVSEKQLEKSRQKTTNAVTSRQSRASEPNRKLIESKSKSYSELSLNSYHRTLHKSKERDEQYMNALRNKLNMFN